MMKRGQLLELIVLDSKMTPMAVSVTFRVPMEVTFIALTPRKALPPDLSEFVPLHGSKGFAALTNQKLEAVTIDIQNNFDAKTITSARQRIAAFSANHGVIAISSDDGRTLVYSGKKTLSIPTYRNAVTCSSVAWRFGIIVICCDDGSIVVGSAYDGSIIRVIQVDMCPESVIVTPSWGFIVVNGYQMRSGKKAYFMSIFNVNGVHVRNSASVAVERWTAWSNCRGFDFILMCGDNGRLFAFEAFFGEIGEAVGRCSSRLICLEYWAENQLIVGVTEEGRIHLIPFTTKSIETYL
jgi:hypothetical protein